VDGLSLARPPALPVVSVLEASEDLADKLAGFVCGGDARGVKCPVSGLSIF
jgi:hypothetical protein